MDLTEPVREPPWLPPPDPPTCLVERYAQCPEQRGGTLIAEDVRDRVTHARRVCSPDGYRPSRCPRCGHDRMHVHDYVERKALGDVTAPPVLVVRYRCAHPDCLALWRVLPAFVPRHLWYAWPAVQDAGVFPRDAPPRSPSPSPSPSPPQSSRSAPRHQPSRETRDRWRSRLGSSARLLVEILATLTTPVITALLATLAHPLDATRAELTRAYARTFGVAPREHLSALAGHIHRLEPGARLM